MKKSGVGGGGGGGFPSSFFLQEKCVPIRTRRKRILKENAITGLSFVLLSIQNKSVNR
jgi:hypothetical protein